MILGIGTDVASEERFQRAVARPGVAARLLTAAERERSVTSQAGRFAAKEALAKALGAPAGLVWTDVEVRNDQHGRPFFVLTGTVAARAQELGVEAIHLSISHDAGVAVAMVVCEGNALRT